MDKLENVAKNLIDYSLELKHGDKLVLENFEPIADELTSYIREYCKDRNIKVVFLNHQMEEYIKKISSLTDEQMRTWGQQDLALLKSASAHLKTSVHPMKFEGYSLLPKEARTRYEQLYYKTVHIEYRVNQMKWCLTEFPVENEVTKINFNAQTLREYYYTVCGIDYQKLAELANILEGKIKQAKGVRIVGVDIDLTFSIDGMGAVPCIGKRNFPDGEVYTAPIRDSVNGVIKYNIPTYYNGLFFNNVRLEFKNGKIIKATCDGLTKELNEILDTDEGARYIGEFSFGVNWAALHPIGSTLIDEKLAGTLHLTPGTCYKKCDNGNHSVIHWDLVCSQRPENGGGEIYLDGQLFRKDGYFVDNDLQELNPPKAKIKTM